MPVAFVIKLLKRDLGMTKILQIRAHHFLCEPGYKGVNYDQNAKTSWDTITTYLKENPNAKIEIVEGPDSFCSSCPKKGVNCTETYTKQLDDTVQKLLDLKIGAIYIYKQISEKLKEMLDPEKHAKACGDCYWRTLGFCKDTFKKQSPENIQSLHGNF
jgi:hypothetical protein